MPAFQFQVRPKVLVGFEGVEAQTGEVLGQPEQDAARLNDFLEEEEVRPIQDRQIYFASREPHLQCLLHLQNGLKRRVRCLKLNRQV